MALPALTISALDIGAMAQNQGLLRIVLLIARDIPCTFLSPIHSNITHAGTVASSSHRCFSHGETLGLSRSIHTE
ncbi:hypothetical protein EMIT0373P_20711 [Pseudomonas chlororaphis]